MEPKSSLLFLPKKYPPLLYRDPNQINLLKPTGHVMHQQFNIQQL